MTRLLSKPLKVFTFYSLIILIISIPVYVLVVDYIWINELDENNWHTLQHTKQKLNSKEYTPEEIDQIKQTLSQFISGVSIYETDNKIETPDSVYEVIRPNIHDLNDNKDRFRGLKSSIDINGKPYIITIESNIEESDETFLAIAMITLVFFLILIVGFIILNRIIAVKTWKPFYQTLESLRGFDLNNVQKFNLPSTQIQEFKELNESIEQMVKRNVDTYEQQKLFTENASHELQTPIALLKSKLDMLFQQKNNSPEIYQIINGIQAPLSRLSRINKNLLLLAKVENNQYSEIEELDIRKFLESTIDLFEDYINEKKLQTTMQVDREMSVKANAFLLETLIHNLFSNAIRYTPVGGEIIVKRTDNSIEIRNTGKVALDQKHLFERFSSTGKDKVGSGLGLAIIQEIVNKYNWQIDYKFEDQYHVFSVSF